MEAKKGKELHFFELMTESQRGTLFRDSELHHYRAGTKLVVYGEIPKHLFFIEEGRMAGKVVSRSGQELTLRILGPGNFFAYAFSFRREPSLFDYEAQTNIVVRKVKLSVFESFIQKDHDAAIKLISVLIDRLESAYCFTAEQLTEISTIRVAHIVGRLAARLGVQRDGQIFLQGLSHQDIASFSGLSRPRVTESLNLLQSQNLLKISRSEICVLDVQKLIDMEP